jgi:hypothetical protein
MRAKRKINDHGPPAGSLAGNVLAQLQFIQFDGARATNQDHFRQKTDYVIWTKTTHLG